MKYVRFYGGNGYCGCDYEEYEVYEDNCTEDIINQDSIELAYENAETYEYIETGWNSSFESEEDRDNYYENVLSYCSWDYCSEEEYKENH